MQKSKLQFKIQNLLVTLLVILPGVSHAATLYFNFPLGQEVGVGQTVLVEILLDADGEKLNAVEMEIQYPKNLLKPISFSDGGSIINLWVERPDPNKPTLILKGAIPGGFNWNGGLLGKIIFEALKSGTVEIQAQNFRSFLNDGEGTEAKTTAKNLEFGILNLEKPEISEEEDSYPPEKFTPEVIQDPNVYNGQYVLAFATQDKHFGIDYYEVQETSKKKSEINKWERTESPYLLKDQTRESYIFVKAVDRKGNERVEKIYPISYKPWYQRPVTYIIVALLLVLAVMAVQRLRRTRAML